MKERQLMKQGLAVVVLLAFASTACGGRDGLSEKDHGNYLFWKVSGIELTWTACTDAQQFRDLLNAPPTEENSFIAYRVSDDGNSLIDQNCTAVSVDACSESGLVWTKEGDTFTMWEDPAIGDELAPGCRLSAQEQWEVRDLGQELEVDAALAFDLVGGGACTGVNENIAATGTNEFGMDGCKATFEVLADFYIRLRAE